MRKFLPLAIIVLITFILFVINNKPVGNAPAPTNSHPVTFSIPNGVAKKGSVYTIRWGPGKGKTDIFLVNRALESEGISVSLADRVYGVDNNGFYNYKIPTNIPSGEYRFQIGQHSSEYFTIQ